MSFYRDEKGSVTVVALLILVILTILGITITRTTNLDLKISTNELFQKQNFYVVEGGVYREAAEVGFGSYAVTDINTVHTIAKQDHQWGGAQKAGLTSTDGNTIIAGSSLPGDADGSGFHVIEGAKDQGLTNTDDYDFTLRYEGHFLPPKGYSATDFSRYDFSVDANDEAKAVNVSARYYRIGPKAN
jgi:hypothetical protein